MSIAVSHANPKNKDKLATGKINLKTDIFQIQDAADEIQTNFDKHDLTPINIFASVCK